MKKTLKIALLILLISLCSFFSAGCWNYREIDEMAIVSGVAIDKGVDKKYLVTMEIVELTAGTDLQLLTRIVSVEGNTMFDAVRNIISYIGKKSYWSHAKLVIVSQDIARDGLVKVIDWFSRDAETRENIFLLVSKEETAKEIFEGKPVTSKVLSFQLQRILENQQNLEKAPFGNLRDFINTLSSEGICPIAPAIGIKDVEGIIRAEIMGTAIFKSDKFLGFLDGTDTQTMLFIQNKIRNALIHNEEKVNNSFVTLEIFTSKTKVKPIVDENNIMIDIHIEIEAAIDEIDTVENLIEDEGRKTFEQYFENMLNNRIAKLIKDVQTKYGTDIFGFGTKLYKYKPSVWRKVADNWHENFKNLKVNVNTKFTIIDSAQLAKPLEVED